MRNEQIISTWPRVAVPTGRYQSGLLDAYPVFAPAEDGDFDGFLDARNVFANTAGAASPIDECERK